MRPRITRSVVIGAVLGFSIAGVGLGAVLGAMLLTQHQLQKGITPLEPAPYPPPPVDATPATVSPVLFEERAEEIVGAWPDPGPFDGGGAQLLPLSGMDPASPADTTLTVHVGHGACDTDFGAWLRETEELVIVGGWNVPDPTVACTEQWLSDPYRIGLESELGDRPVIDAVSGTPLSSSR
ncbi:hypothetical protein AB0O69_16255 [Streptomyces xiamenensis]|uniref:hypothetical protein n=1 Tax=Streptomyces xiamenensis TaxID=408015 RepID=UPI003423CEFE